MKTLSVALLGLVASCQLFGQLVEPKLTNLRVGDEAPDFTLTSTEGQKVTLSDFRGKNTVVLAFYPAAFTGG
jgi:thioredoxin-dependent peroxiredoxin